MSGRVPGVSGLAPNQLTFSFIQPEDQRAMAALYEQHVSKTDARAARSAQLARKRVALKVVANKTLEIDWTRYRDLLDLPLLQHEATDLDVQPEPSESPDTFESSDTHQGGGVALAELDHEAIVRYHEGLLRYSLNVLKSKGNAEEKYEVLQWIWSPDIFCWAKRQENGNNTYDPVPRNGLPFTFQTCCGLSGLDYERLRDGLSRVLKPTLEALGLGHLVNT